jgi:hypothetical protein
VHRRMPGCVDKDVLSSQGLERGTRCRSEFVVRYASALTLGNQVKESEYRSPLRGSSTTGRAAASTFPAFEDGTVSVIQRFVIPRPGPCSSRCGEESSNKTQDRPWASCVVTTRRNTVEHRLSP